MTPAAIAELLDVLSRIGVMGVTLLVIFGFLTGRIVTKGHVDEVRKAFEEHKAECAKRELEVTAAHAEHLERIDEDLRRLEDRVRGP